MGPARQLAEKEPRVLVVRGVGRSGRILEIVGRRGFKVPAAHPREGVLGGRRGRGGRRCEGRRAPRKNWKIAVVTLQDGIRDLPKVAGGFVVDVGDWDVGAGGVGALGGARTTGKIRGVVRCRIPLLPGPLLLVLPVLLVLLLVVVGWRVAGRLKLGIVLREAPVVGNGNWHLHRDTSQRLFLVDVGVRVPVPLWQVRRILSC